MTTTPYNSIKTEVITDNSDMLLIYCELTIMFYNQLKGLNDQMVVSQWGQSFNKKIKNKCKLSGREPPENGGISMKLNGVLKTKH